MLFFAAATALDKVQQVPTSFWIKCAIGVVGFMVAVIVLRKLAAVNKVILIAVIFVAVVVMGFKWIYERDEPAFLTPIVERIAPFFPTKGAYVVKQQVLPGASVPTPTPTPTPRPKR